MTNIKKRANKEKLLEMFGNACMRCGYNKSRRVLSFHHRDPSQKKFIISGNHSRKFEILVEEAKKCDILCANCHLELHDEEYIDYWNKAEALKLADPKVIARRNNEIVHGTYYGYYHKGCRCEQCKAANANKNKKYRDTIKKRSAPLAAG